MADVYVGQGSGNVAIYVSMPADIAPDVQAAVIEGQVEAGEWGSVFAPVPPIFRGIQVFRAWRAARGAAKLTGQLHHGISRTVHKALEAHPNLRGLYSARDSRFVTQAKDLASHRGYDTFHRNLDAEVAGWVRANPSATQAQFETYLRGVYQRADVLERFPNGL